MKAHNHRGDWAVGSETSRESHRFRFPVYSIGDVDWPRLALFEQLGDAHQAAFRYNDWPRLRAIESAREHEKQLWPTAVVLRLVSLGLLLVVGIQGDANETTETLAMPEMREAVHDSAGCRRWLEGDLLSLLPGEESAPCGPGVDASLHRPDGLPAAGVVADTASVQVAGEDERTVGDGQSPDVDSKSDRQIVRVQGERGHDRSIGDDARSAVSTRVTSCDSACAERIICAPEYAWSCRDALAVSWCESRWDSGAVGGDNFGLFQISAVHSARVGGILESLFDPVVNVRVAYELWREQGWGPWACAPYMRP